MAGTQPDPGITDEELDELIKVANLVDEVATPEAECERATTRLIILARRTARTMRAYRAAPVVTLTDLQVLALLVAAPVDPRADIAHDPKPGHVSEDEHRLALSGLIAMAGGALLKLLRSERANLARVLGLPPPPSPGAALRMRVEWATAPAQPAAGTEPDPGAGEDT